MFSWTCAKENVERGLVIPGHGRDEGRRAVLKRTVPREGVTVHICFLRCMVAVVEV